MDLLSAQVFGLRHLKAGLAEEGRTDEILFELHPEGDLRFRPLSFHLFMCKGLLQHTDM